MTGPWNNTENLESWYDCADAQSDIGLRFSNMISAPYLRGETYELVDLNILLYTRVTFVDFRFTLKDTKFEN